MLQLLLGFTKTVEVVSVYECCKMGNGPTTCPVASGGEQLSSCLTQRQIQLVQVTWDILKEDLTKLGVTVFLRFIYQNPGGYMCQPGMNACRLHSLKLFETEHDLKSLFPKIVRMNDQNELEYELDREMLQKHAISVMEGIGAAVESLEDSDFLNNVLLAIGQNHSERHVKPQMLKSLWPSLNHGFKMFLGTKYTKEVSEAWKKVYMYICLQMKRGMENPELEVGEMEMTS